jgi:type I restriction enzyme S subunit
MEVRPGYKRTEVGVIPKEWDQQPVGQIIERLDAGVSVNSVEDSETFGHNQSILKTSAVKEGKFLPHECKKNRSS